MRMTQRLTSLLLSLMMLLTMLPGAVLAESEEFFGDPSATEPAPSEAPAEEAPAEEPEEEFFGSIPEAPEETPAPEATAEPTAEPTEEPTAIPTAEPTAAPASDPTAEPAPVVEKDEFVPGLARIGGGAKLYEHQGLWGAYMEAASGGVVYAIERNDKETAIRICLFNGVSLWEGWANAYDVTLLSDEQTAAYDEKEPGDEIFRTYRGHDLRVVRLVSSEPTEAPAATPTPDVQIIVPIITPEPEAEYDLPADPTAAPAPEKEDDEVFSDADEVFGAPAPEVTMAPVEEPTFEEVEAPEISKFVEYRTMAAPANLSASHTRLGVFTLTWDGTDSAEAYQVLYKKSWQTEYSLLAQVEGTSYTTDALDPTEVYYFRVQAVELNDSGSVINQSPQSASLPYIVLGDVKINDPRGKDPSTIRLTWNAVGGATHYDVMMCVHGTDDWAIVRTDLTTDYCDIANLSYDETYDFRVIPKRVLNSGTVLTGNSSRVAMVGSPMETPSFYDYTWTETGLQLTWDAIPGASGYVIYRRAFSEPDVTNYSKLVVLDEPVTSYIDTTMIPGEVYYYFVYSFKLCEPEGWRCFSLKGDIGMGVWMGQPTGIQGTSTVSDGVYLTWDVLTGANYYDVFITTTSGTLPTGSGNGRVDTTSGYHSTAKVGNTYYYRVRGVREFSNGDYSYGPWSEEYAYTLTQSEPVYRALLVGNTYPNESNYLVGCDNDSAAMAMMLGRMTGTPYQVTVSNNLTDSGMINAIASTFANATANDVSLFYFSGHGANAVDTSFHGALVGVHHTYLSVARLKESLDAIPGKKIVIIDSCHSGQMIGKGADAVDNAALSAFNSLVVNTFAASTVAKSDDADNPLEIEDGVELFTKEPLLIARGDSDLANPGYYVITAAHSTEESVSTGYDADGDGDIDKYFGLFTYSLCHGNGWNVATDKAISTLNADLDGNNEITLYEAYVYAKTMAQRSNPNQTAQIYPANSGYVVWAK